MRYQVKLTATVNEIGKEFSPEIKLKFAGCGHTIVQCRKFLPEISA